MFKVVISTVGTSVLPRELHSNNRHLFANPRLTEAEKKRLFAEAKDIMNQTICDAGKNLRILSAEINCLDKIQINQGDKLFFLTTETPDGVLCGELVADFCRSHFQADCYVRVIQGLQVTDAEMFEKIGLNSFVDEILTIYNRYRGYPLAFNITGGFKAVVPYTTLLGLVLGSPTYYVFEQSNQLIRLPAAPVNFNLEILKRLEPVINRIENDYMSVWDFLKETGMQADEWAEKLSGAVIEDEQMVTLSPLGRLLYKKYLTTREYKIMLSLEVQKKLRSGKYDRNTFDSYFEKMKDPSHLRNKEHNEIKCKTIDCDCYKPGNASERIFYYIEGGYIKICDIFMHDNYTLEINQGSILKKNYTFDKIA